MLWHLKHLICMVFGHRFRSEYIKDDWTYSDCERCGHTSPDDLCGLNW